MFFFFRKYYVITVSFVVKLHFNGKKITSCYTKSGIFLSAPKHFFVLARQYLLIINLFTASINSGGTDLPGFQLNCIQRFPAIDCNVNVSGNEIQLYVADWPPSLS